MTERFEAPVDQPSTEPPAFHVVWPVQGRTWYNLGVSITLSEAESRRVVSRYGVPVSPFVTGTSTAEVLAAVETDASVTFPVVANCAEERSPTRPNAASFDFASPTPTPSRQRATNSSARPFPTTARSRSSSPRWSTATAN